jgi:hypothetical protein
MRLFDLVFRAKRDGFGRLEIGPGTGRKARRPTRALHVAMAITSGVMVGVIAGTVSWCGGLKLLEAIRAGGAAFAGAVS